MKIFKRNIIIRFLCLFMALQIFNLSIDTKDSIPDNVPEDLTINDQESFIELVLEKFLGFENAVSEHDESDQESGSLDFKKINLVSINFFNLNFVVDCITDYYTNSFSILHQNPCFDVAPRPPQA